MAKIKRKILDIETRKRKDLARLLAKPFAIFDPDDVKTGNFGATAAKAKIEKAEAEHAEKEIKYYAGKEKEAGLVPEFSEICTIGWIHDDDSIEIYPKGMSEVNMLEQCWKEFQRGAQIVGHTLCEFDLPMLVKRSWIVGVTVPPSVFSMRSDRFYWSELIFDIAKLWNQGVHKSELMRNHRQWSLAYMSKVLGCARERNYEVTGEMFANFWDSPEAADNTDAELYLTDDLLETSCIFNKLY